MTKTTENIVITSIILLASVVLFEYVNIDIFIEDYFYNFELKQWVLDRDSPITKFIFYDGIKLVLIVAILLMITGLLFFRKTQLIQTYQKGLVILVLSAILVPTSVATLKSITNIPCPKNIKHYGGTYPHVTLLKKYPQGFDHQQNIKCFPAAHASGGFGFLALIFLFNSRRNKIIAAFLVLSISWGMGTYKMLIGDHFLSHTVVSMILAWLDILIIVKVIDSLPGKFDKISRRKSSPVI